MIILKIILSILSLFLAFYQLGSPVCAYWFTVSVYWTLNAIDEYEGEK